jgi:methylmalonyl-CoA mutase
VIGVNTYLREGEPEAVAAPGVSRATEGEKWDRIERLRAFQARHAEASGPALERLRQQVRRGGNLFEVLMDAVRVASLGQITAVLYEMGGRYRRSM